MVKIQFFIFRTNKNSLSATFIGGRTWFNSYHDDLIVNAANGIRVISTTQRISTVFQESNPRFNVTSTFTLVDSVDLIAFLSETTFISEGGQINFFNDVYMYSLLSLPIINAGTSIKGSPCSINNSVVIQITEALTPQICLCVTTWRCSINTP